jgi:hypothetical protein
MPFVRQGRYVGQVDARDRQRAAAVERGERGRHQFADRREEDRRVERLWRHVGRPAHGGSAKRARQLLSARAAGHHVYRRTLGERDLRGQVRAAAEAV